mgnify:CR=1 FL=1
MTRLIDVDALCEEFKERQKAALRWKEKALLDGDEERSIRADATLAFLSEVKLTIDNAPTVEPDMEFAKWVTKMIFGNNEFEDFDFELFSELACRKLEKLGLVKKAKSEWIEMKEGRQ